MGAMMSCMYQVVQDLQHEKRSRMHLQAQVAQLHAHHQNLLRMQASTLASLQAGKALRHNQSGHEPLGCMSHMRVHASSARPERAPVAPKGSASPRSACSSGGRNCL
jgi:hypothetical protein